MFNPSILRLPGINTDQFYGGYVFLKEYQPSGKKKKNKQKNKKKTRIEKEGRRERAYDTG